MALATCKEMERWYERVQQVVERLEYIEAVQQGREKEEHGIRLVGKSSLNRMKRSSNTGLKCLETRTEKSKNNGPDARSTGIKSIK
jgi:hypothetical protein